MSTSVFPSIAPAARQILAVVIFFSCSLSAVGQENPSADRIRFDRNHSTLGFSVPILGGLSHVRGKFTDFDVSMDWDDAASMPKNVSVEIRTASVSTGIANRDADIQGDSIFDSEHFPNITFVSSDIRRNGSDYVAIGNFTMRGITHEIFLPFSIHTLRDDTDPDNPWRAYEIHYALDRRDYGITWQHNAIATFFGYDIDVDIALLER